MDTLTSTLITQLLDKALENTQPEERLAFVEKLFSQLPPPAQQEFMLSLTRTVLDKSTHPQAFVAVGENDPTTPRELHFLPVTADDFAPGQICCQALTGFARLPGIDDEQVVVVAQMFNGLADETRLKIVKLLAKSEFTVDELVEFLGIAQSTTSHHLRVLKEANLIKGEKRGRNIYYSLIEPHPAEAVASLSSQLST